MKVFKKTAALLLAVLTVLALSSCSKAGKWILKTDTIEIPVGAYISYLSNYYSYASYLVSDTTASPVGQTLTTKDDDGNEVTKDAAQWMQDSTLDTCVSILNIFDRCEEAGITLTAEEKSAVESAAQNEWDSYGDSYEKFGVALSSLRVLHKYTTLTQKYFDYLYGNNGVDEVVTDAQVREFFLDNYASTTYFRIYLGNYTSGSDDYNKLVEYAKNLATKVQNGSLTMEKALAQYNTDYSASKTLTNERKQFKTAYTEEYYKNFSSLSAGACTSFVDSNYAYVLVKNDVKTDTEYLESSLTSIRRDMRNDVFNEKLKEQEASLTYTVNDAALSKYSAKWLSKQMSD